MGLRDDIKLLDSLIQKLLDNQTNAQNEIIEIEDFLKIIINNPEYSKGTASALNNVKNKLSRIDFQEIITDIQNLQTEIEQVNYNIKRAEQQKDMLIYKPNKQKKFYFPPRSSS